MKYFYNLGFCFDEIARSFAERPALHYPESSYSFRELHSLTVSLSEFLIEAGCEQGDVIAIGHTKKPLSYALMLAALRIGNPYVCFDLDSPVERTSSVFKTTQPKCLFYDDLIYEPILAELSLKSALKVEHLRTELLQSGSQVLTQRVLKRMQRVDGATIAYIMFTSGSTGAPKGVAVTHCNLQHLIAWGQTCFAITEQDNFANVSPMYFDNSVFDFFVGLFSGAALTPISKELAANPYEMVPYVEKCGCSVWFSVPSLLIYMMVMKAFGTGTMPKLRLFIFGGEGYPKIELKKLYDRFSGQAQFFNVYGPTECTCICSAHQICDRDFQDMEGLPALGYLNQNFDYKIIDDEGNDALLGELCLIGPNVAAGYFNDMERTDASFETLKDASRFMKRMYRTGDIVREDEETGLLYFVGRRDNQIKHMGYRIELEEIEHALVRIGGVNEAAVIYHRVRAAYGKIIGFVGCDGIMEEAVLLSELRRYIPDYMLPDRLIFRETLPKNANGKIDRAALKRAVEHGEKQGIDLSIEKPKKGDIMQSIMAKERRF